MIDEGAQLDELIGRKAGKGYNYKRTRPGVEHPFRDLK
jgi:hypothetical protein